MALWEVIETTGATTSSGGDLALGLPPNRQEGDLLIAFISYRGAVAFTPPTGWTNVAELNTGNLDTTPATSIASGRMDFIILGASDPAATWTRVGGDVSQGAIICIRPTFPDAVDLVDLIATTLAANATNVDAGGGFTTDNPDTLLVMFGAKADNVTASNYQATNPGAAGWTERSDTNTTTGSDTGIALATAVKGDVGATGNFLYTASGTESRHGIIVAAFAQVGVVNLLPGSFGVSGRDVINPGVTPTLLTGALTTTAGSGSTQTFNYSALGTIAEDMKLCALIASLIGPADPNVLTGVTIMGTAATLITSAVPDNSASDQLNIYAFVADVPQGSSGNVVASWSGTTADEALCALYHLANADDVLDFAVYSGTSGGDGDISVSLDTAEFGGLIALGSVPLLGSGSFTDLPQDATDDIAFVLFLAGSAWTVVAETDRVVAIDGSTPSFSDIQSLVAVSFPPLSVLPTIDTEPLTLTLSGTADFLLEEVLPILPGSFTLSGELTFEFARGINLDMGAFLLLGEVDLISRREPIPSAEFLLSGSAQLSASLLEPFSPASLAFSGRELTIRVRRIWEWEEAEGIISSWDEPLSLSGTWTEENGISLSWTEQS